MPRRFHRFKARRIRGRPAEKAIDVKQDKMIRKLNRKVSQLEKADLNFVHANSGLANMPTITNLSSNTALDGFVNAVVPLTLIATGDAPNQRQDDICVRRIELDIVCEYGVGSDFQVIGPVTAKFRLLRINQMKGSPINNTAAFPTYGDIFQIGSATVANMQSVEIFARPRRDKPAPATLLMDKEVVIYPEVNTPAAITYASGSDKLYKHIKMTYVPKKPLKTTYLSGTTTGAITTWVNNHYVLFCLTDNIGANTTPPRFNVNSTVYYDS